MENANVSEFAPTDGDASVLQHAEGSANLAINEASNGVELFLERQGAEIHPIFDPDHKYLQQRFSAPIQNVIK